MFTFILSPSESRNFSKTTFSGLTDGVDALLRLLGMAKLYLAAIFTPTPSPSSTSLIHLYHLLDYNLHLHPKFPQLLKHHQYLQNLLYHP